MHLRGNTHYERNTHIHIRNMVVLSKQHIPVQTTVVFNKCFCRCCCCLATRAGTYSFALKKAHLLCEMGNPHVVFLFPGMVLSREFAFNSSLTCNIDVKQNYVRGAAASQGGNFQITFACFQEKNIHFIKKKHPSIPIWLTTAPWQ